MGWVERIGDAVKYIEDNITEDITVDNIAEHVYVSPFYFQKGFSMLCGFTVYDSGFQDVPKFWDEHYAEGKGDVVCGMFGISIDESMGSDEFEYMIADNYMPWKDVPDGFVTKVIPKHTWAVFPCKGPLPKSLQAVNTKIFSEWLTNCREYEIAAGYNVELYSDPNDYPNGAQDENYYSEMWIPVKKK